MFERILYPTDFSDVSKKAMGYVKQLKDAGAKEVTVLHVIDERSLTGSVHEVFIDFMAVENELRKIADEECGKLVAQFLEKGLNAKFRIEKGIPFLEILKVSKEEKSSIIVIGSHGKSNIEEMLLGSVSEAVIRKADQPVLVVKR
ncbi:universal stress protein [Syntrophus aciditrophicus]|uniref:Universal stress protein family n=1 Tax=Syntrophus aciditrophicus (strain SB) TaxID=56780 RepID=Q2LVI8_SYNAS|nr:universal stress protein [Syntrophus aciditrophicus]ABC78096.1 universal stress protein family [Syntrophus aciditrophicus SB]OPY18913.1 MAG: Universal stress protein F [Syntrophus sp. PtaB.Bin075]